MELEGKVTGVTGQGVVVDHDLGRTVIGWQLLRRSAVQEDAALRGKYAAILAAAQARAASARWVCLLIKNDTATINGWRVHPVDVAGEPMAYDRVFRVDEGQCYRYGDAAAELDRIANRLSANEWIVVGSEWKQNMYDMVVLGMPQVMHLPHNAHISCM